MSKRGADNYLTDQNWDQEEESEEAGIFKQADKNVLQTRQLKKAKRRVNDGDGTGSSKEGAFKGFSGFTGFTKTTQSTPLAAFGNLGSKTLSFTNGSTTSKTTSEVSGVKTTTPPSTIGDGKDLVSMKSDDTDKSEQTPSPSRQKYLQQLKALNQGVSKWIKEHVDKDPYCILTPIFKDYDKYLVDIEKKYPQTDEKEGGDKTEGDSKKDDTTPKSDKVADTGMPTIAEKPEEKEESPAAKPLFSFGSSLMTSTATSSTASSSTSGLFSGTGASSGFSFTNTSSVFSSGAKQTSGFTFGSIPAKKDDQSKPEGGTEEEEYVPPKADVTEVNEDDAIYSKRCKLFFKKEDAWKEKGVGNLHLKPCGDKTQLLIRADTNLGNILLNIMLSTSLPISRQGKNNVSIICIPNPPIDPKSEKSDMTPLLIRVKTADDADELFEKLKEHKS